MFFRVNPSSDRIARALGRFARERLGLVRALEQTGGKREGLPSALTKVRDVPSWYGPLSMNEYGDVTKPVDILQVRNGTFTVVTQIAPRSN